MTVRLLGTHIAMLFRDLVRTPAFVVPAVIFPAMFFAIFALPYARTSTGVANSLLASYVGFAVIGVALFQFGVSVAMERGRPWERYLRSLPVSIEVRFAARIVVAAIFAAFAAAIVCVIGKVFTPVSYDPSQWLRLALFAIAGAVPFMMLGLAIAYIAPPRGALPITNIVYLLAAFCGGLWMPPQFLPSIAAAISPYLPTRQFGELLWSITAPGHDAGRALLMLGFFTAAFSICAIAGYRRDERTRYA